MHQVKESAPHRWAALAVADHPLGEEPRQVVDSEPLQELQMAGELQLGSQWLAEGLRRGLELVQELVEELRMAEVVEPVVYRHGREEAEAARVMAARRVTETVARRAMADKQAMEEVRRTAE